VVNSTSQLALDVRVQGYLDRVAFQWRFSRIVESFISDWCSQTVEFPAGGTYHSYSAALRLSVISSRMKYPPMELLMGRKYSDFHEVTV